MEERTLEDLPHLKSKLTVGAWGKYGDELHCKIANLVLFWLLAPVVSKWVNTRNKGVKVGVEAEVCSWRLSVGSFHLFKHQLSHDCKRNLSVHMTASRT